MASADGKTVFEMLRDLSAVKLTTDRSKEVFEKAKAQYKNGAISPALVLALRGVYNRSGAKIDKLEAARQKGRASLARDERGVTKREEAVAVDERLEELRKSSVDFGF